jgi:Zn-dependent protease with chaperone function
MNFDSYILAAIYLVIGADEFSSAFADNTCEAFTSNHDAQRRLRDAECLSENQRTALFSYLYLYTKLTGNDNGGLRTVEKAFNISPGVMRNIESVITGERVEYIAGHYKKHRREFWQLFVEPEDFIAEMIVDITAAQIQEDKKKLKGLNSREYEHPTDKAALEKLESIEGMGKISKKLLDLGIDRFMKVNYTGSCFMVTKTNLPYVYNALKEVCDILDMDMPPLYLDQGWLNAFTVGAQNPIVVLNSSCLSLMSYDELLYILGHEVGHIKSGHFLYHTICSVLPYLGGLVGNLTLGFGNLMSMGIQAALLEWQRKSEFTADRAGLLACQNPNAALSAMTKLAGYPITNYSSIDTNDLLQQAQSFEELDRDAYDKAVKFMSVLTATHPWTVLRAKEINRWVVSGDYNRVLERKGGHSRSLPPRSNAKSDNDKIRIQINLKEGK